MTPYFDRDGIQLFHGDCLDILPTLADGSIDAVITDPPYPEIDRPYGRWTEAEWWDLMMGVCGETRRMLKPDGSAVFILQPNSRKVGSMRGWLFRFQAWACDEWNMVQDAWWWNTATLPQACTIHGKLLRPSIKACVWCGPHNCYRDQDAVLWEESDSNRAARLTRRAVRVHHPSGHSVNGYKASAKAAERGGTTPFNVFPLANTNSTSSAGSHGHGAGTPGSLADWWTRYISPPGGTVADWFTGSGTMALAAIRLGRRFVGIERSEAYCEIAAKRIEAELAKTGLFASA